MISAVGIVKRFRPPANVRTLLRGRLRGAPVVAVDGIDVTVEAGEVVGVMGANGSGKSTLLRIITGLVTPSAGRATVDGFDIVTHRRDVARRVGYVAGDERGLTPQLSPLEHLAFFGALYGLDRARSLARAETLCDELALGEARVRPMGQLSTGMRRRVALARGFLGSPSVLVLDEPTRGIDPAGAASLREYVARFANDGGTVILATHDVEEARVLCRRTAHMDAGRIVRWAT